MKKFNNVIYAFASVLFLISCSSRQSGAKDAHVFDKVNQSSSEDLDSIVVYGLNRMGMSIYDESGMSYTLNPSEVEQLLQGLKDKNNFYGGTPLAFQYTSIIKFYGHDKSNSMYIATDAFKVVSIDFDIPYNRVKTIKSLGGASSFPFIKDDFVNFLKKLEEKMN